MQSQFKLFVALLVIVLLSCKTKNSSDKIEVEGEVKNIEAMTAQFPGMFDRDSIKIVLFEVPFGGEAQPVQLDSVYISKKNPKFKLSAQTAKQSLYDVMLENGPMIPVINDEGVIKLDIDLANKESFYAVAGSSASRMLHDFIFGYSEKSIAAANTFRALDSLKALNSSDSLIIAKTEEKNKYIDELNAYLKQSIVKADNPLVAAFTLGMASRTFTRDEYDSTLTLAIGRHPSDANLQYLKSQLKESDAQQEAQAGQAASWIGKQAPEMSMPDVNGKETSIASFKGKYVLVDFWASWCGPCRMENPNVVKAYNAFKNKNFTVLGVSLDKDKEKWLEAIKKDNLTWTHISDLAYWNSKSVEIFNFQGIPYNVLINPEGIIIGESLRGADLEKKLKEVLK